MSRFVPMTLAKLINRFQNSSVSNNLFIGITPEDPGCHASNNICLRPSSANEHDE